MAWSDIAFGACNVVATSFAAYAAWRSAIAADKSVEAANRSVAVAEASERAAQKSADAAKEQVAVALMQKQLAQRQVVIQLWDRMTSLKPIDPKDPKPMDVHNALSTMELIGLCCEGGMIDASVIKRTFADRYIELYQMVEACEAITNMQNKTGVALLRDNRCAMTFYDELIREFKGSGQLSKV